MWLVELPLLLPGCRSRSAELPREQHRSLWVCPGDVFWRGSTGDSSSGFGELSVNPRAEKQSARWDPSQGTCVQGVCLPLPPVSRRALSSAPGSCSPPAALRPALSDLRGAGRAAGPDEARRRTAMATAAGHRRRGPQGRPRRGGSLSAVCSSCTREGGGVSSWRAGSDSGEPSHEEQGSGLG